LGVLAQVIERETGFLVLDLDMHGHVRHRCFAVIRKIRPRLPIVVISDDFTNRIRKNCCRTRNDLTAFKPKTRAEVGAIFTAAERIWKSALACNLVN
jgi:DNA-binding NarL/FixJ family response regulator